MGYKTEARLYTSCPYNNLKKCDLKLKLIIQIKIISASSLKPNTNLYLYFQLIICIYAVMSKEGTPSLLFIRLSWSL